MRSPCRIDVAKGKRRHRCSRQHADVVYGYRAWRDYEYDRAETEAGGYATELTDYWQQHPDRRPTFGAYLIGTGHER